MSAPASTVLSQPASIATAMPSRAAGSRRFVRDESFDALLLLAPLAASLTTVAVVVANPRLFPLVLLADLWLLGYHHVISTYTRLASDWRTFRQNRFLAADLLGLVTLATLVVAYTLGSWVIATAYLYLQWFHYVRQGYGVSRMYFRATSRGAGTDARDNVANLVVYLVPVYLIAWRSANMGDHFLFMPVRSLALPEEAISMLGIAAAGAVLVWLVSITRAWMQGRFDAAEASYALFVLSHLAVFCLAYGVIDDVNAGWLAINVWHNLQYVLVVWMTNLKRFAGGVDQQAKVLSSISQPGRAFAYFGVCIAMSTLVYFGIDQVVGFVGGGLAITASVYMGINFHHYIVDALIWKRRRVIPQPT